MNTPSLSLKLSLKLSLSLTLHTTHCTTHTTLHTHYKQDDEYTHLYTLILRADNTYEVKIDNKKVEGGAIEEDWDVLLPKTIFDPEAKKPETWDDRAKIDDPEDTKPEVKIVGRS